MIDHNLETVNPHDPEECDSGLKRIRDERDEARNERDRARTTAANLEAELARTYAWLLTHGINIPDLDDVEGAPV